MNNNFNIQYRIGASCYTEEFTDKEQIMYFLQKQFQLSLPLITGANIIYKKKKENSKQIYVGKEINVKEFHKERYNLEKYDISLDELADIAVLGYERACLLNYKKYDTILIGVEKNDIVVPDYFALKEELLKLDN